jgi:hypothetical protein
MINHHCTGFDLVPEGALPDFAPFTADEKIQEEYGHVFHLAVTTSALAWNLPIGTFIHYKASENSWSPTELSLWYTYLLL